MGTKSTNYGRRILKCKTPDGNIIYRLTGQWVGHLYGDEWGTPLQRDNARCGDEIIGISEKIFWNKTGYAGEILKKEECENLKFKC